MITTEHVVAVKSGLFQIDLPLPIRPNGVQVYLFHNGTQSVLIDTGLGTTESLDVLHDALQEIGCDFSDIALTICTHYHPDHYGASRTIKRLSGCEVLMHKADAGYLIFGEYSLHVMWTPGHTPGQISMFVRHTLVCRCLVRCLPDSERTTN